MNEQQIDALPPVQPAPSDNQTAGGGAGSAPAPLPVPPQQGGMVNPGTALPSVAPTASVTPPISNTPQMPAGQPTTTGAGTPPIADDVDLIEKEWVAKAKQIVESTKQDPYQQNQAITGVKADYLKKRYNRDLKTGQQSGEA